MDKKYYKDIVKNINSIILRFSSDGTILFMNPYGCKFFGYKKSELVGKKLVGTIVRQKDANGRNLERMLQKIVEQPENFANNQNENVTKDGRSVWIGWTNHPVCDKDGNITEILSVGYDHTHQKQHLANLENMKDQFNEFVNNLDEFVWMRGRDDNSNDKYIFASPAFKKIFGYPAKKINYDVKKFIKLIVHPDDQYRVTLGHQKIFEKTYDMEYRAITADGRTIWVNSKTFPIKNESGEIIKVIGITRDITEKKLAELEYLKMLENCPERQRMKK